MDNKSAKPSKFGDNVSLEAQNSILYLASWINQINHQVVKPYNISLAQYHVLRILKISDPNALTISQLTERMIDKMSNTSRIVDKLCSKKLTVKKSDTSDKRKVKIHLTEAGRKLMEEAMEALESKALKVMEGLSFKERIQLRDLSDKIRKETENS